MILKDWKDQTKKSFEEDPDSEDRVARSNELLQITRVRLKMKNPPSMVKWL